VGSASETAYDRGTVNRYMSSGAERGRSLPGTPSARQRRKNGSMNARLIVGSVVLGLSLVGALSNLDAAHASPSSKRLVSTHASIAAPKSDAGLIVIRKAGGSGSETLAHLKSPLIGLGSPLIGLRSALIGLAREDDPFNRGIIAVRHNDDPFNRSIIAVRHDDDLFNRGIIAVVRKAGGEQESRLAHGCSKDIVGPEI
jgi:hypothetical protein